MQNTINDLIGNETLGVYEEFNPILNEYEMPKSSVGGTKQPPIKVTQEPTDVDSGSNNTSNNTSNNNPKKKNTLSPTIKLGLIIGGGILAYVLIKKITK